PTAGDQGALFFVRDGQLIGRAPVGAGQAHPGALAALLAAHLRTAEPPAVGGGEASVPALAPAATNVLLRWIHERSGRPELIPAGADALPDELAAAALRVWRHLS